MDVLWGNVFHVDGENLSADLLVQPHPRWSDNIRKLQCRIHSKEYRRLKKLGQTPDVMTTDIQERTYRLENAARKMIAAMENNIKDLYSPEGLYVAFVAGWLPVPELWSDSDEFIHAKCWETKMTNGGIELVNHGLLMTVDSRIDKCIGYVNDAEKILKTKYLLKK